MLLRSSAGRSSKDVGFAPEGVEDAAVSAGSLPSMMDVDMAAELKVAGVC